VPNMDRPIGIGQGSSDGGAVESRHSNHKNTKIKAGG
jgi:hypothetical protein